jgi:plasmid stabilization system protein ParE
VPRLIYRTAALHDLADIAAFIERESASRAVAEDFINRLTTYCENLATLPGLMGRERAELRPGIRSTTFGNYVIFMRYLDQEGPRSHLAIVNVIHGARDMDAYFAAQPDDEGA